MEVLVHEVVGEHDALGGKGCALGGASHFGQSGLRGHADGQVEFYGQFEVLLGVGGIELQRPHVGVEVGDVDSTSQGLADLGPGLEVGLLRRALGIDLLHGLPQVAVGVDEARNLRARGDRAPAIDAPFRGLGQVQTEVFFRVCFGVTHHLGEPRARDH